jgi:nucleoside-diphosphate-sugar epimerase
MLLELAVKEVAAKGRLETVVIRPSWFYGPYQPPRQTLFFGMIRDGKAPIVGGGNNLRSMSYIDNLCQGLQLAALTAAATGQTYWIADRRPYSMNEIVDTVERLLENEFHQKCAHKRLRLPGLASDVARLCDTTLQGLGLYHQKIHVLSEMNQTIACSVARAERELGYRPAVALEEGMRRSLRWCFDHHIKF